MPRNYFPAMMTAATAVVVSLSAAHAQTAPPPPVPSNLQVPAGNVAYLTASAVGTQNYVCLPSPAGGLAWKFQGPQATLFVKARWFNGTEARYQVATHFLSLNTALSPSAAQPTWQSSMDTSAVWAKKIAESTDSAYVAPAAIPWFLLEVTGARTGPMGGSLLSRTTYIQRVNTTGGVGPTGGCPEAGVIQFVDYTADYVFYRPAGSN